MKKDEFDHAIRAAGAILGTDELLVIGSQAIHASAIEIPNEAERSIEVDIAVFDDVDGTQADLIDASIGEASMFHESFGYYAQGVTQATAVLPRGWRDRLVRYRSAATAPVVAWCLEPHDLWIAKAIAHRPKDQAFCRALLSDGLVEPATLEERLVMVADLDPLLRQSVEALLTS